MPSRVGSPTLITYVGPKGWLLVILARCAQDDVHAPHKGVYPPHQTWYTTWAFSCVEPTHFMVVMVHARYSMDMAHHAQAPCVSSHNHNKGGGEGKSSLTL